jgi:hypothetical protein
MSEYTDRSSVIGLLRRAEKIAGISDTEPLIPSDQRVVASLIREALDALASKLPVTISEALVTVLEAEGFNLPDLRGRLFNGSMSDADTYRTQEQSTLLWCMLNNMCAIDHIEFDRNDLCGTLERLLAHARKTASN